MSKKTKIVGVYTMVFMSALVAFFLVGLNSSAAPASNGDWISFIVMSVVVAAVGAIGIGSLVVFRGRLSLKRSQQNHAKQPSSA